MNATVMSITAGGIAGSIETVVTMPFEVTKTWQQLHSGGSKASTGMLAAMRQIVATNRWRGLYYGMPAMLIQTSMKVAIRFAALENFKACFQLICHDAQGKITKVGVFWSGCAAGATEAVLWVTPWERLKILRQAQIGAAQERHTAVWKSIQAVVQKDGLPGLYHGLFPTLWRNASTMGLRFIMYDYVKERLVWLNEGRAAAWHPLLGGLVVGAVGTVINNPIDVVKSVVQAQESDPNSCNPSKERFHSARCVASLWQRGGVGIFFEGLTSRLWKISTGQAVIFFVYDHIMQLLQSIHPRV